MNINAFRFLNQISHLPIPKLSATNLQYAAMLKYFCSNSTKNLVDYSKQDIVNCILPNEVSDNFDWNTEMDNIRKEERSPLEQWTEDISHIAPNLRPTFNFAAYIDDSPTLQELVKLGVNLHKLEKKRNVPEFVMKLDFKRDIQKYLIFLHDHGVPVNQLGYFLTTNPFILNEDMDYLDTRVAYLKSKKFSSGMIAKVLSRNPHWLMFSTERIDRRLGHFQKEFSLLGKEVRKLAITQPRLVTYKMEHIKLNTFVIKEEMGFDLNQTKRLLMMRPKLWMLDQNNIVNRFEYVHKKMKISHTHILNSPDVLFCRTTRIKERHLFLKKLDRAQYDSSKENYISLENIYKGNDADFCKNVAKSTPETYNMFLKTL